MSARRGLARPLLALGALLAAACAPGRGDGAVPFTSDPGEPWASWPVVATRLASPAETLEDWALSDAAAWRIVPAPEASELVLAAAAHYQPPHRSPLALALLPAPAVGDFLLDVELSSTTAPYGHRDLCLFFGYRSPSEFRYAHLATAPDAHAHNLFRVSASDRVALAPVGERGVRWESADWHHARLLRRGGELSLWFDGELSLQAQDPDPQAGLIGLGSFDDTGRFRTLVLRAPATSEAPERAGLFAPH